MAKQSGNELGSTRQDRSSRTSSARFGRREFHLYLAACATFFLADCDGAKPAREWPAGTLVLVDEIPVTSAEFAQDVAAVMLVEPQWGEAQLKRLAFNEIALPRALMRTLVSAEKRDTARRSIDEQYARISSGSQFGPPTSTGALGHEISGSWRDLGLLAWGTAMDLEAGAWSEVFETNGAFMRVRLLERIDGPVPGAARLRLDTIEARFVANPGAAGDIDSLMKRHRLTIVDPAWETIVPERTKYLMGVHEE